MSEIGPIPGDEARVTVLVAVPPDEAFRIFTEEIDRWWRRGLKYRLGRGRSVLHLEPRLGGRLYESFDGSGGGEKQIHETGRITRWEPPTRLSFDWLAINFSPGERTEVEVVFTPSASGTTVTLTHRGWSAIRPDHPVRHHLPVPAFFRMLGLWWGDLLTALREHGAGADEIRR